ncbi:MAG: AAA family ATPase [Halobacteriota archaeon]
MQVIGIVGLPGSGKSEAAAVAREMDIPVVTMGDVVRAETADRGLDPASDHGRVAQAMREENGLAAIADRSLPIIESALEDSEVVLVDGIRSGHEVAVFEEAFGDEFTLIEVFAPYDLRAERIADRGRDAAEDDGGESLVERDERERGFGMDDAIEAADVTIENTDSLEAFRDRVRTLLAEDGDR